ncbi:MAG: hypothetical protein CVV13_10155 [Gammaproteobacteria bacterium HGW-Gammaproteobacteria-3]|nr:MAG: hypothetical protein CVV13_10155 [Gammaproteobacteria bacterium HGW-Gammaproteobacteria-3]
MKTTLRLIVLAFLFGVFTLSCAVQKKVAVAQQPLMPIKTLTATGYGTVSRDQQYRLTAAQRKLIAMRASKMDALRTLSEQVYGLRMEGQTAIEDMTIKNDNYRAFIDAFLRGAHITGTSAIDRDTYETTVELELTSDFYQCILGGQCSSAAQPAPLAQTAPVAPASTPPSAPEPISQGCNGTDCYRYPEVQGFTHSDY